MPVKSFLFKICFIVIGLFGGASWALELSHQEILLKYEAIEEKSPETKLGLDAAQRKNLLQEVANHPVVALDQLGKYDPPPAEIGFCFGRAMAAHLLARKKGVSRDGIRKLFIAGDMKPNPNQRWRFHVTTLVRDEKGEKWYSIDPVVQALGNPDPLLPKDWLKAAKNAFDPNQTTKNYITETDSILADMREVPSAIQLENNERIIEVNFNPNRPGFEREVEISELGDYPVFRLDEMAQEKYFIQVHERLATDSFDFFGLAVKILTPTQVIDRAYDFHGYFSDLLASLSQ